MREGLLSDGYLCLRFGGLIFGRAYFGGGAYYWNFTVLLDIYFDFVSVNIEQYLVLKPLAVYILMDSFRAAKNSPPP